MLAKFCLLLAVLIVLVGVVEYVWDLTPLEQAQRLTTWTRTGKTDRRQVIRLGVAAWQMGEFPWEETVRRYEQANPGIRIVMGALPEGYFNTMQAYWRYGHTTYDVIVAWADEEINAFIQYNWNSPDPARRSMLSDVRQYLSAEQFKALLPGLCVGSSRPDPARPGERLYFELPWMGEVLALNYNKLFFKQAGIGQMPQTWEEVEQACRKLKGLKHDGRTIAPLAMNFAPAVYFAQNCYIPMLAAFKQGRGIADADGRLDVSSPEAERVFETLKRWYDAGYISPDCMVNNTVEQDLRMMRSAMFPHWQSRGLEAVRENGENQIGILPTPGASVCGTLVSTYGSIVPKCSPVAPLAVKFAYEAFSTDRYGFQSAVARAGKLPAMRALYGRQDLPRSVLDLGPSLDHGYFFPDLANWPQCARILVMEFQKYLNGNTPTAAKALADTRTRFAAEIYSPRYSP